MRFNVLFNRNRGAFGRLEYQAGGWNTLSAQIQVSIHSPSRKKEEAAWLWMAPPLFLRLHCLLIKILSGDPFSLGVIMLHSCDLQRRPGIKDAYMKGCLPETTEHAEVFAVDGGWVIMMLWCVGDETPAGSCQRNRSVCVCDSDAWRQY